MSEFKIGDTVQIVSSVPSHSNGWENSWVTAMNEHIGRICTVTQVVPSGLYFAPLSDSLPDSESRGPESYGWPPHGCKLVSEEEKAKILSGDVTTKPAGPQFKSGDIVILQYVAGSGRHVEIQNKFGGWIGMIDSVNPVDKVAYMKDMPLAIGRPWPFSSLRLASEHHKKMYASFTEGKYIQSYAENTGRLFMCTGKYGDSSIGIVENPHCCGVGELGGFCWSNKEFGEFLITHAMKILRDQRRGIVRATTTPYSQKANVEPLLKAHGFKEATAFVNPRTMNVVNVWELELGKILPPDEEDVEEGQEPEIDDYPDTEDDYSEERDSL